MAISLGNYNHGVGHAPQPAGPSATTASGVTIQCAPGQNLNLGADGSAAAILLIPLPPALLNRPPDLCLGPTIGPAHRILARQVPRGISWG